MDRETLNQRIALWKAMPFNAQDQTDTFVDALIERIDELEREVQGLVEDAAGEDL